MAISDSYLKSCLGRERDKVEEKADRDGLWVRISKKGAVTFSTDSASWVSRTR